MFLKNGEICVNKEWWWCWFSLGERKGNLGRRIQKASAVLGMYGMDLGKKVGCRLQLLFSGSVTSDCNATGCSMPGFPVLHLSQSLLRLRLQNHGIVSMLSDPGKIGIKTVYEDRFDELKGDENSKAQLASACVACDSVLCASCCTFWQCLCSSLVWIFSVLIILFSGNSVYIQGSINSTDS